MTHLFRREKTIMRDEDNGFHNSFAFVLFLGQCFALIPVQGIFGKSEQDLYFTWKSLRVFYCLLACSGPVFPLGCSILLIATTAPNIFQISAVMFFLNALIIHILFLNLAIRWPKLVRKIKKVEIAMKNYGWPPLLNVRLRLMTAIIFTAALIEHGMIFTFNLMLSGRCKTSDQTVFEYFCVIISYPEVFTYYEYIWWKGVLMQLVNFISTMTWTYIDLFIMLISTSFAFRFQQITERTKEYVDTRISDVNKWRILREDYNRMNKLCKHIDENLSYIVLVSFASNLFFILIQLFNSLRKMDETLEKVYFFFSFGFLICRTVCVSLYGASIDDESKKPLPILHAISTTNYNIEVSRFTQQVCFDPVALTGKKLFSINRGLILSICSTVVSYELIIIQFYGDVLLDNNHRKDNRTVC